jgi:TM2 domain-containing membrane protein YozV
LEKNKTDPKENPIRSPILAEILSLIVAGLGQIYGGQVLKGLYFIVVQLVNTTLTTILIGWILMPTVGLWTPVGEYKTARAQVQCPADRERRGGAADGRAGIVWLP